MSTEPHFDLLAEWCLFCHPEKHGQQHQVMLRSTNFYLFAGLGAIIPGYVIITPYRCEGEGGLRSMAEAPAACSMRSGSSEALSAITIGTASAKRNSPSNMAAQAPVSWTAATRVTAITLICAAIRAAW